MLPMVELTIFALGILLIDLMVPRGWKWINAAGALKADCGAVDIRTAYALPARRSPQ